MRKRVKMKRKTTSGVLFHHVMDGRHTKGWVHTHGMDRFGLPELEIRNVPSFLAESAALILRHTCDYMLDSGRKVSLGETMGLSDRTVFQFVKSEPLPGEDEHYRVDRWEIAEVECLCEECRLKKADCN